MACRGELKWGLVKVASIPGQGAALVVEERKSWRSREITYFGLTKALSICVVSESVDCTFCWLDCRFRKG